MAGTGFPSAMQNVLRGFLVLLQAAEAFRTGPANGWRLNPPMRSSAICAWTVIRYPFARTARRSVPASRDLSDSLRS